MPQKMKRLTIALPDDVWQRLQQEAFSKDGVSIGTYLTRLVVKRDSKRMSDANEG
jgi:hypothetical protein